MFVTYEKYHAREIAAEKKMQEIYSDYSIIEVEQKNFNSQNWANQTVRHGDEFPNLGEAARIIPHDEIYCLSSFYKQLFFEDYIRNEMVGLEK